MNALGVDVGLRKGLDLVLLDDERRVIAVAPRLAHDRFRETVLSWAPDVVCIDSPPRWATTPEGRQTELQLFKLRIGLYKTPTELRRAPFHDWMIAGMSAFSEISDRHPLYDGSTFQGCALEVFPHATAVVLAGGLMPQGYDKRLWRRGILDQQGIDRSSLKTNDQIDAALAALTGIHALNGEACSLGAPEEGVIILPCLKGSLPPFFQRLGDLPPDQSPPSKTICGACHARNPRNSRFCNQCGTRFP